MAVMAFGMLAIVGVQQTLRVNADISKQRNEATRWAEKDIEEVRDKAGKGLVEFNAISGVTGTRTGDNTSFTLARTVALAPDNRSLMVNVLVTWLDRVGTQRRVEMHDLLARVDPMLSGLVRGERPLTPVGKKNRRHPTIPEDAANQNDGTSIFNPPNSGTTTWVFNNSTGAITHRCPTSSPCTALPVAAQLLAGEIRYNLRGAASDHLGTVSVLKPINAGTVAWVIDPGTESLVRVCTVPDWVGAASLTAGMVSSVCTTAGSPVPLSPFAPIGASDPLLASDSESPSWPSIPANVALITPLANTGLSEMTCYSDAERNSRAPLASLPKPVRYFCIAIPVSSDQGGWAGRTEVVPLAFSDGGPETWAPDITSGKYKVCRYTTASDDYTESSNHPATYGKDSPSCGINCRKVTGNLINQNFLIINGQKTCPTDLNADPANGDLVNSNTLQHQPLPP